MPVVASLDLQAALNAINVNLALPINEAMVKLVANCVVAVHFSPLATDAERVRFHVFMHEVEHAFTSCVNQINMIFSLFSLPGSDIRHVQLI